MTSNVFTKKDILQNLASRGCFIDVYTLDAFFAKKKIEAIFEDSQGNEFFDNNALNMVIEGLFNSDAGQTQEVKKPQENIISNDNLEIKDDKETLDILNNISLSDGTPVIDKLENIQNIDIKEDNIPLIQPQTDGLQEAQKEASTDNEATSNQAPSAVDSGIKNDIFDIPQDEMFSQGMQTDQQDAGSFDDITLLSESFEAQEKLRQYVMSELSRNNLDMSQQRPMPQSPYNNEFKLDISERTLNMIARTMARKIAKYVGSIMAQDAKQSSKVAEYEEENRRLTQKTKELEEQNRKLRLLLAESNKNLNSYKPSIFGLYKKIDPKANKK